MKKDEVKPVKQQPLRKVLYAMLVDFPDDLDRFGPTSGSCFVENFDFLSFDALWKLKKV